MREDNRITFSMKITNFFRAAAMVSRAFKIFEAKLFSPENCIMNN